MDTHTEGTTVRAHPCAETQSSGLLAGRWLAWDTLRFLHLLHLCDEHVTVTTIPQCGLQASAGPRGG